MTPLRTYAPLRAKFRRTLPPDLQLKVFARAGGRCEVEFTVLSESFSIRCNRSAVDHHHVQKRSQGGDDTLDNVIALCREHHDRTDWPYKRGRLVIRSLGQGRFECAIVTATGKFALRTLEEPNA